MKFSISRRMDSDMKQEFARIDGKFTLSDDSHGVAQIGLNFQRSLKHVASVGVQELYHLEREEQPASSSSKPRILIKSVPIQNLNVESYPSTPVDVKYTGHF
jgi:histidinol-phosphatase (PHP family)